MRAFRQALGERLVYFTAPDFSDVSPGFGERMAEELERKVEAGACGLKIFKDWHFAGPEFPDHDVLLTQCNRVVERHPDTSSSVRIWAITRRIWPMWTGDWVDAISLLDDVLEKLYVRNAQRLIPGL